MRMNSEPRKSRNQRRSLNDEDRISWADAQDRRETAAEIRTREDVRALLRQRNPIKWMQIQRDIRWVEKEMKKMGLNPEDARSVL